MIHFNPVIADRTSQLCGSLLAVGAFGLTTAVSYGMSGLIDWLVAAEYLAGGLVGGLVGMALATSLALRPRRSISRTFLAAPANCKPGYNPLE